MAKYRARLQIGIICALVILFFGLAVFHNSGKLMSFPPDKGEKHHGEVFSRIISMAPSITEVLYSLGLGDKVVGVTRFCKYPKEARQKTKIGGHFDPNYEAMVALEPDLVVMLVENEEARTFFAQRNIVTLAVNHQNTSGVLASIKEIGDACGVSKKSDEMLSMIRSKVDSVRRRAANLNQPKVLISVGRNLGSENLGEIYVSGIGTFYDELIEMAGGKNAYQASGVPYPKISREGLLMMNPDVIIDLAADIQEGDIALKARSIEHWNAIKDVAAVQNHRVHVFTDDFIVIPGPRFWKTLEAFFAVFHPEERADFK